MQENTRTAGEILRNAGKRTMALQVFSAILLVVLAVLYIDMSSRQAKMQDSVRENAMWSAYQLDREVHTLDHDYDMVLSEGLWTKMLKTLSKRYDIVYSRVDILHKARFASTFQGDRRVQEMLTGIKTDVKAMMPLFDRINAGSRISRQELQSLDEPIGKLTNKASELLMYANNAIGEERANNRDKIIGLQQTSAVTLFLLLASVSVLIFTLRRQLKSLKVAGLELENIASALTSAYNAADAGNRAKSQFMATMGHEIRTPLNAILGIAELMTTSKLDDADMANVHIIHSSGEALLEIINEILDFAKIEHGSLELEERNVELLPMLEKTVSIISGRATAKGTKVVLEAPTAFSVPVIRTDPTRLRQVILNLLSNGVKFTDHGQVTLRIAEHHDLGDLHLRVEVQDTGIGIDNAGRDKLFKPFSQVDNTISRKYGGTGLGLTICKQIIEQMGGRIGVESIVGRGSTFWFDIPVAVATQDDDAVVAVVSDAPPRRLPEMKILLVEDNLVNQNVAMRFLARLGQTADIANHGGEAVEMTENNVYDVILMDMQMPIMDGIEATRQIKSRGGASAQTPIYAMTANASEEDRERCFEIGMAGFETKPVTLVRLRGVLNKVCDSDPRFSNQTQDADSPTETAALPEPAAEVVPTIEQNVSNVIQLHKPEDTATLIDPARREELVDALGEEIYEELLTSFFDDAVNLLDQLHAALAASDEAAIDAALHTIKGSAANVGLPTIANTANDMRKKPLTETDVTRFADGIRQARTRLAA